MGGAPYDERNAKDYDGMTKRIEAALEIIEDDETVPATEAELCKLAKCSRGTLRNRKWPLEQLKAIKKARKEKSDPEHDEDSSDGRTVNEILTEENKKLKEQLDKSRTEAAEWVDKYQNMVQENKKLRRANNILAVSRQKLKEAVGEYERQFGKLDRGQGENVVVPFP